MCLNAVSTHRGVPMGDGREAAGGAHGELSFS